MSQSRIVCDQAIFTSIRSPMGEGYRIVATSHGLKSDDKQCITQQSPSHDNLCGVARGEGTLGAILAFSFYPLPSGRHCAALSVTAGTEHTGRGGHRIYTHIVAIDPADMVLCGYNPFNILRAMVAAELSTPQLKPPDTLRQVHLTFDDDPEQSVDLTVADNLKDCACREILEGLLGDQQMIVPLKGRLLDAAEAMILGVPGPNRDEISFSAGVKFSVSRIHRLCIVDDDTTTKRRAAGQPVCIIDTGVLPASRNTGRSKVSQTNVDELFGQWYTFVERHWANDDLAGLAQRSSCPFEDTSAATLDRFGRLYGTTDQIGSMSADEVISLAGEYLTRRCTGIEAGAVEELIDRAHATLTDLIESLSWSQISLFWPRLVTLWKQHRQGCEFAHPLITQALQAAFADTPITAARTVLQVAQPGSLGANLSAHTSMIERLLKSIVEWARTASEEELATLAPICDLWADQLPSSLSVQKLHELCTAEAADSPSPDASH